MKIWPKAMHKKERRPKRRLDKLVKVLTRI